MARHALSAVSAVSAVSVMVVVLCATCVQSAFLRSKGAGAGAGVKQSGHGQGGQSAQQSLSHMMVIRATQWTEKGFPYDHPDTYFSSPNAMVSPYAGRVPFPLLDELDPVAPFDRTDHAAVDSLTGSAPSEPGSGAAVAAAPAELRGDSLPPSLHAPPFPYEANDPCSFVRKSADPGQTDLQDRQLIAQKDKLRMYGPYTPEARWNYPNAAPADAVRPVPPTAPEDALPEEYSHYFNGIYQRDDTRMNQKRLASEFRFVDKNSDGAVDWQEFKAELMTRQGKTEDDTRRLFDRFKNGETQVMAQPNFVRLAAKGFSLDNVFGQPTGKKMTQWSYNPGGPGTINGVCLGYWGSFAPCTEGAVFNKVKMRLDPFKPEATSTDNTALNAVDFQCADSSGTGTGPVQSSDGKRGAWTGEASCPGGMFLSAFRSRAMGYQVGQDNSALNNLMFRCSSPDMREQKEVYFGKVADLTKPENYVVVESADVGEAGGWSVWTQCEQQPGATSFLCGVSSRLMEHESNADNMGLTDLKFSCCYLPK